MRWSSSGGWSAQEERARKTEAREFGAAVRTERPRRGSRRSIFGIRWEGGREQRARLRQMRSPVGAGIQAIVSNADEAFG